MRNNNRGAALLMVLVVVGLLTVIVVESLRRSQVEALSARNNLRLLEGQALAVSGYSAAAALLIYDLESGTTDGKLDIWYAGEDSSLPIPVDDRIVNIAIEDESGKFPLGALVDNNGKYVQTVVTAYEDMLIALNFDIKKAHELADALVDWIDDDSRNDNYEYNPKYTVANSRLTSLEELSRIEVYQDLGFDEMALILKNVSIRTDDKINVNTASVEVLSSVNGSIAIGALEQLVETLATTPDDTSFNATTPVFQSYSKNLQLSVSSNRFKAIITADVDGVNRRAECQMEREPTPKTVKLLSWVQY